MTISTVGTLCAESQRLELFVGGGPAFTGPNFHVALDRQGRVSVRKTGLPIVPPGKLTEERMSLRLSKAEVEALLKLAEAADDFAEGNSDTIADGTFASLIIEGDSGRIERRCHAAEWPKGQKTKLFLEKLNARLPRKWRVF